ncbi:phosphodiester glycosidase family protein [Altererythrobacter sp. ZODW24]|uniref:phosphodiester glycosidase family protein n=1 Tax=Altererythrobacter sp. ZODW24 TaxID=2185142 RepID=UPI000DF73637|nr:phosphodiester glycosidase family protein [Altererythrobacter sp. ZODW24]
MRIVALAALALVLTGCEQPAGEAVSRVELGEDGESGTTVTSDCKKVEFEGSALTHCIADPADHRITTSLGPKAGEPFRSLPNLAGGRAADAPLVAFAVNGGMYDDAGQPIGYYVERGERLKKLNQNEGGGNFHMLPNGVFFGSGAKWEIKTSDDFYKNVSDRPRFGTQSGPMLVIGGKLHPEISDDGESKKIRNAVGIGSDGRAHFVISEGSLSFGRLARFYRDELKVPNALFLDGTVSSLWDPATGRLDNGLPLGPLIVVEKKD